MADSNNVVGIFDSLDQVEAAVKQLTDSGISTDAISVVANNLSSTETVHGVVVSGTQASHGAATGAGWGALTGAAAGGLFSLLPGAALIWVPGAGALIALGPLAAMLGGALTGAGGGAIVGALVGHGIPKEQATTYEKEVQAGKYLLVVTGGEAEAERAQQIMRGSGSTQVTAHAS
jgi:hypothetical protein